MTEPAPPEPSRLASFTRWRRTSDLWAYGLLAAAWGGLTAAATGCWRLAGHLTATTGFTEAGGAILGASWVPAAVGVALFLLLFEVGLADVVAAAWKSHPRLELEGEAAEKAKPGQAARGE